MSFIIYKANGQIVSAVNCLDTYTELDVSPDLILEDTYTELPGNYYVDTGILVAIPTSPNPEFTFNYTTKTWEDNRTLADTQYAKKRGMDSARVIDDNDFIYQTKTVKSDSTNRINMNTTNSTVNTTGALPVGWPGSWLATDGTTIPITTVAEWNNFYAALLAESLSNFDQLTTKKAQIDAYTTNAQVDAIVWDYTYFSLSTYKGSKRDALEASSTLSEFTFNGNEYKISESLRLVSINLAVNNNMPAGWSGDWPNSSGVLVSGFTKQVWKQLIEELADQQYATHLLLLGKLQQLAAAITIAEVEAI